MKYPTLYTQESSRQMVDTFRGYHHSMRIADGEFYDMKNMTSDHYPVLSSRDPRRIIPTNGTVNGMAGYDRLYYIRDGILYQENVTTGIRTTMMTGLSTIAECSIVRMGNYLLAMDISNHQICQIDNPSATQQDIDHIDMNGFSYAPCTLDGTAISPVVQDTAPASPEDGIYWMDTSGGTHVLKQWSESKGEWNSVPTSYVKLSREGIGNGFRQYDGIRIWASSNLGGMLATVSGAGYESSFVIMAIDVDSLVVAGLCDQAGTAPVSAIIERKSPQMRYVVECGNRLWGCSNDGHEIYASKLGDPYNWNCYQYISTDSYTATIGAPGVFTGAVAYGGTVYFFKQDCMIKIYGTEPSNFQITEIPCDGVQEGSGRSLCTAEGMLFYKSKNGVYRYDGSLPEKISDDLGMAYYKEAVGGAADGKYYLSMLDESGAPHLFVYDIRRDMWNREDGLRMTYCSEVEEELYAVALPEGGAQSICILNYHPERHLSDLEASKETDIPFMAETGEIGLSSPDMKYVSRLTVRMAMEVGAEAEFYARYDMDDEWVRLCRVEGTSLRSFSIPIRPRRCDHMRLRIEGTGKIQIYSITKTIEEGSEIS